MWEWLWLLFSSEGFVARWDCGVWPAWLGWLHIVADLLTFLAYVAIPVILLRVFFVNRELPVPRLFALFAAFIFACGAVHLVEAVMFWVPVYRLSGVLKAVMAVVSVATVVVAAPAARWALRKPATFAATSRLAAILSATTDAVIAMDLSGRITSWNRGAETMYGYGADEMIGESIERIVPADRLAQLDATTERVRRGERIEAIETERLTKSGERRPVSLSITPIYGRRDRMIGMAGISRDISAQHAHERKLEEAARRLERANRRLRKLADSDALTGLRNRRGIERALAVEVERMRRHGSRAAAVLVDCDDFKSVNERFGHDGGDEVLREIGNRIEDQVRDSDVVGRLGGDEFLVLATDLRPGEATLLAHRIRQAIAARPVTTSHGPVAVAVSCGVESIDPQNADLEGLVGRTSAGLKVAKRAGKDTVATADTAAVALPGPSDLRALAQAIVDVANGEVRGYEFLVRGPRGPLESPERLFRAHRERDSLTDIDLASLDRCLATAADVKAGMRVHVNLLPSTLIESDVDKLGEQIAAVREPRNLYLEINEAMLVGDPAALAPSSRELRRRTGCRLAIDDVGYGRSSLEALLVLEPDVVKIDRRFVHGIATDARLRRQFARLVRIGRAIGAEIIAEGVEREVDRRVLLEHGVELAQGYLWGRPSELGPAAPS